jgi:hypothetical protein
MLRLIWLGFELVLLGTVQARPSPCDCTAFKTELVTMEAAMRAAKEEIRALRAYVSILRRDPPSATESDTAVPAERSPFQARRVLLNAGAVPPSIQSTPQHFEHRNVGRDLHGMISEFEANLLTYQVTRRRCIVCVQQQVHHRLHRRAAARAVGVVARFHSAVPQTFRVISLSAQNVATPHKSACLCAQTCLHHVVRSH